MSSGLMVSDDILSLLGLGTEVPSDQILDKISRFGIADSVPVFSENGKEILAKFLADKNWSEVEIIDSTFEFGTWRYLKVENYDGAIRHEILCCPRADRIYSNAPQTSGEYLLLSAWLQIGSIDFSEAIGGKVIFKSAENEKGSADAQIWKAAVGCASKPRDQVLDRLFHSSYYLDKSALLLSGDSEFASLLSQALSETTIRWRFFQFYRLLEHAYLGAVFNQLQNSFFVGPEEALKDAQKKLSTELEQFKALVLERNISSYFEKIFQELQLLAASNDYTKALFASVRSKGRDKGTSHEQGISLVYSIRCSIAHSGIRDLYYEKYKDADATILLVQPILEEAVLDCLGIM